MLEAISKLPFLGPIFSVWLAIAFLVISSVLDAEIRTGTGNGAAKKQAAIASIDAQIDAPGGPDWPSWLPTAARPVVTGFILEMILFAINQTGFFKPSKAG